MAQSGHFPDKGEFEDIRRRLLSPEGAYFRLAILFSAFVSLLTLAVPISIQMLIDQVANTALLQPVIVLAGVLFSLLIISGIFYALREYVLELFQRRVYARLTSEITLKVLEAPAVYFDLARRDDLINRYFDIMTVQKTLPHLLVGLFTFFFQAAIGFAVTSLYHPALLIFNIGLILGLFSIWKIWGWRATETSFRVSQSKYDAAAWIEGLTHQADLYKAGPHSNHALDQANVLVDDHVGYMRAHFRLTFQQLISLLGLYAVASSVLLGIGGALVIAGELTLGQLVAAELILSAIFSSFGLLGGYLKDYYILAAALEELFRFSSIPSPPPPETRRVADGPGALSLKAARVCETQYEITLSAEVEGGCRALVSSDSANIRRTFMRLLKGHVVPTNGAVMVDGVDIRDWDDKYLHEDVVVIDRSHMPQLSIKDFLRLAQPGSDRAAMQMALETVGLIDRVNQLAMGLDTPISPSGWPFTAEEILRLKLAAAILDEPRLLVIGDLYDQVSADCIDAAIKAIAAKRAVTTIAFSNRQDLPGFTPLTVEAALVEQLSAQAQNAAVGAGAN